MTFPRCLAIGLAVVSACSIFAQNLDATKVRGKKVPVVVSRPLNELVIKLKPGMDVSTFSVLSGFRLVRQLAGNAQVGVFAPAPGNAINFEMTRAQKQGSVEWVIQNKITPRVKHWVPNDPFYPPFTLGSSWPGQWYLNNTVNAGRDLNVVGAWNNNFTGAGVVVATCDDCLEGGHEDIAANFNLADSWNYETSNTSPTGTTNDGHGTCTGGIIGARGANTLGGTGVAPLASLSGIRFNFNGGTGGSDADFAAGISYHSAGANTNIKVKNHSYGIGAPFIDDTLSYNEQEVSGAAGTIHCWSAGNSRGGSGQDTIKQQVHNSQYAIVVTAMGSDGKFSNYSSFGAAAMCAAPSDTTGGNGVLATDRTGSLGYNSTGTGDLSNLAYTAGFGGTSAAAPMVTGVATLVKQAQPNLDGRFFKHLLVRTCRTVDAGDTSTASDGGWRNNGAGNHFNQNYGFGLVDASALTTQAQLFSGVTAQTTTDTGTVTFTGATIPDNNPTGITRTLTVSGQTQPLEAISLKVAATHTWRGDLIGYLTSPSGYKVRMFINSGSDSTPDMDWVFTTNAFWGESGNGTWTFQIADIAGQDEGTLDSLQLVTRGGALIAAGKSIAGTLTFTGRVAGASNLPTTVDIFAPGGTSALRTYSITPNGSGGYSFTTDLAAGTYDIAFKGRPFLRRRVNGLVLGATGAVGVNATCLGGDIDNDNRVNLNDFSKLSLYYGRASTGAGWTTVDGNGVRPMDADITGDGRVNLNDFSLLSINYGGVGN